MIVGRLFGWLLLAIAALLALGGVILAVKGQSVSEITGAVWYRVDLDTLNGIQVVIERHLSLPALWANVAVPLLNWPLWVAVLVVVLVPAVLGLALVSLFRPRGGGGLGVPNSHPS